MLSGEVAAAATLGSPQKNYIESLNMALDDGKLSAAQVSTLTRLGKRGVSSPQLVNRILSLPQTQRIEIKTAYANFLGQAPSARQMSAGLAMLRGGQDQRAVERSILGSQAFYARSGANDAGFVDAVYQQVLGHSPSANDSATDLSLLAGGASRRQVAAHVLNSPEMIEALFKSVSSQALTPAELEAAEKALSRPGGLRQMEGEALSSPEFVRSASLAPAASIAAPNASTSPVDINGYVTGLPLGQEWDLASRWTPLVTTDPGDVATTVATAGDGTVWETVTYESYSLLETYVPSTGVDSVVLDSKTPITSIAALSSTQAWITTSGGVGTGITVVNGIAEESPVPLLPSDDTFAQLAAGTDGTIWALGTSGNPYVYSSSTGSWAQEPKDGYKFLSLSVGSATNVWAQSYISTVYGNEALYFSNGTWYDNFSFENLGLKAISASPDGSAWAVTNSNTLYTWNPTTSIWSVVTGETPPGPITALSAISQYRVNAVISGIANIFQSDSTLELLTYGVVDQPAVPFPAFTGGEETAYIDLSEDLGVTDPPSLRGAYDNPDYEDDFYDWSMALQSDESEPPPPGVNEGQWEIVTKQLAAETKDVSAVFPIFTNMTQIAQMVDSSNQSNLTTVTNDVQLSNGDGDSTVVLFLEAAFEAGLAGLAAAAPGGGAVVAAILASGIDSAVTDLSGAANPDYSTSIDATAANLSSLINDIYKEANKADGDYADAILTDWGKLSTVAAAAGSLKWDYSTDSTLADYASKEFEQYFFATLMPVRWNVTHYYVSYGGINLDDYPSYDQYVQPGARIIEGDQLVSGTLWVVQDSDDDTPLEQLFNDIYSMTDVTELELLTNQTGWLQQVDVSH